MASPVVREPSVCGGFGGYRALSLTLRRAPTGHRVRSELGEQLIGFYL